MPLTKTQVEGIWNRIHLIALSRAYDAKVHHFKERVRIDASEIVYDTPLIKDEHHRSSRVYAATERDPGYSYLLIHIHTGLLRLPLRFVWGILLHEAGHVATWGKHGSTEDQANDWVQKRLGLRIVYKLYRGKMLQSVSGTRFARL